MREATKRVLEQIDEVLATDPEAGVELWDVMTGLRGPDNGDYDLKAATTAVIRTAAFPRAGASYFPDAVFAPPSRRFDLDAVDEQGVSIHFRAHAVRAARALKERITCTERKA